MARVTLPLLGVSATGKLGQAIVYMPIPHARDQCPQVAQAEEPGERSSG